MIDSMPSSVTISSLFVSLRSSTIRSSTRTAGHSSASSGPTVTTILLRTASNPFSSRMLLSVTNFPPAPQGLLEADASLGQEFLAVGRLKVQAGGERK